MSAFRRRATGLRRERMEASPRFSDGIFRNTNGVTPGLQKGTTFPIVREFLKGNRRRVPIAPLPSVSPLAGWAKPSETGLRATWLGHSTLLLEVDGVRVLTDPVWSRRISPSSFIGPKRFQPVPVPISQLPPLDAVVISHDHYDHLDYPSIVELARCDVPFYASLGVGAHLEAWGVPTERITELDWWESVELPNSDFRITAAPSQHFSGRAAADRNRTLWSSFALRGPRHGVFFSGDTGLTPEYEEIARRLGPFDLVMLEVGAFHPAWGHIHLGPDNALEALRLLGGGSFLPVHWGTFDLALHDWDAPAERLIELAPSLDAHLLMPMLGVPIEPSRVEGIQTWWRSISALERRDPMAHDEHEPTERLMPIGDPID
jgi:L-ascorbate metabolism protein UlaG (beta-lactamase superfamily)